MNDDHITGAIIVLGFPDSFVKLSNEGVSKIAPLVGLGNKHGIKAGHSALCTVNYSTGDIDYYDFGRYITPDGYGRTRNVETDEELHIPIQADIQDNKIVNINEILRWLEAHPEKTHGKGVMFASVCHEININKANRFIKKIHTKGSIPYGVFVKQGSNCSRFVFNTIKASCVNTKILKNMKWESLITPSPLGVLSRASSSGTIYKVKNSKVTQRKPFSTVSSWRYLFDKITPKKKKEQECSLTNTQQLKGIGSSAHFKLEKTQIKNEYKITRYNEKEEIDCENIFIPDASSFIPDEDYRFVYDSNCHHCHIQQKGIIYRFNKKEV